ncbi:MAG: hypothetical protein AB7T37_09610 [Dehalococcoidia bacterium]
MISKLEADGKAPRESRKGRSVARSNRPIATVSELELAPTLGRLVEEWFTLHGRRLPWRQWDDVYRVTIVELLLQRTRATTVARFVERFFAQYPSWSHLRRGNTEELEHILAPIGLQSRRALTMQALAQSFDHPGAVPCETSPGVGQYVGRALRVIIDRQPEAMVDSNWVRVLNRVFEGPWMADYRYDPRLQDIARAVVKGAADPRRVNWGVLDLGSEVCRPRNPRCHDCPLSDRCWTAMRETRTGLSWKDPAPKRQLPPLKSNGAG